MVGTNDLRKDATGGRVFQDTMSAIQTIKKKPNDKNSDHPRTNLHVHKHSHRAKNTQNPTRRPKRQTHHNYRPI